MRLRCAHRNSDGMCIKDWGDGEIKIDKEGTSVVPETTAVIQIGNSDDKLPQAMWCQFMHRLREYLEIHTALHFSGASFPDSPWQNACFVCLIHKDSPDMLRKFLKDLCNEYQQDSIALTIGDTEFVGAK